LIVFEHDVEDGQQLADARDGDEFALALSLPPSALSGSPGLSETVTIFRSPRSPSATVTIFKIKW